MKKFAEGLKKDGHIVYAFKNGFKETDGSSVGNEHLCSFLGKNRGVCFQWSNDRPLKLKDFLLIDEQKKVRSNDLLLYKIVVCTKVH